MIRALGSAAFIALLPCAAWAVGPEDSTPPTPTQTTTQCREGQIFDPATEACIAPKESRLDDDTLYGAVREFAYAGAYDHALAALNAMADQTTDRVWTYRGFLARKTGDVAAGMAAYRTALQINPGNIAARSYMGQAFVAQGDSAAARAQLTEIRARGGRGTWAEFALRNAIEKGQGYSY